MTTEEEGSCGDGFEEGFDFSPNQSKSARIEQNYVKTTNFVTYLKDITSQKELQKDAPKSDVGDDVEGEGNESGELEAIWKYLDKFYTFDENGKIDGGRNVLPISFNQNAHEAINAEKLPNLSGNCGDIVILEFFTHCCINCIHSIEDVRHVYEELDPKRQDKIKIVSVHSPKFSREKELQSIMHFSEQMKMEHTIVVNDPGCILWNDLGISCWPTLLILGPNPSGEGMNLLFTMMGEGHRHVLQIILESMLSYFKRKLVICKDADVTDSRIKSKQLENKKSVSKSILRFPGKVAFFRGLLAIADTGNHRIIISTDDGLVKYIIGGSGKGWLDGDLKNAKFYLPQGIAFKTADVIYVADTGNHSIREINLALGKVSTLVPPGWNTLHENETVHLRSPWDLAFYSQDILLVAAAGNHRIFAYFLETSKLFMSECVRNTFKIVAGNGREENRNNSYILKASFAQPSGICVSNQPDGTKIIYIADSESSSIRSILTEGKGKVSAVVGGAKDPTDLFSYGDVDGKSVDAKLQHPMGLCSSDASGKVYFVDTYNNKVKVIETSTQFCTTIAGNGAPGDNVGGFNEAQFSEPGGISINFEDGLLYLADTNNHAIKCLNLTENLVSKITLTIQPDGPTINATFYLKPNTCNNAHSFEVLIHGIPSNFEGGQWKLEATNSGVVESGELTRESSGTGKCIIRSVVEDLCTLSVDIFLCGEKSCYKRSLRFLVKLVQDNNDLVNDTNNCFSFNPSSDYFKH